MSTALVTVCEGLPSEGADKVVISDAVIPFLLAAGWVLAAPETEQKDVEVRPAILTAAIVSLAGLIWAITTRDCCPHAELDEPFD